MKSLILIFILPILPILSFAYTTEKGNSMNDENSEKASHMKAAQGGAATDETRAKRAKERAIEDEKLKAKKAKRKADELGQAKKEELKK